jgi:hypothetical protein
MPTGTTLGRAAAWAIAVLVLAPGGAWAGSCVDTKRGDDAFGSTVLSADTNVRNETQERPVQVELYKDGKMKAQVTLQAGESTSHLAKFGSGDNIGGTIRVAIYPSNALSTSDCNYVVGYGSGRTTWNLQEGDAAVCAVGDLVKVACEKSYHSGKLRWNTTFAITD